MKQIVLVLFVFFFSVVVHAQKMKPQIINGDTVWVVEPTKGDKLLDKGETRAAIVEYRKEFKKTPEFVAYNMACAFARDDQPDSAMHYLEYDAAHDPGGTIFALSDPDFIPLRRHPKWFSLRDTIVARFVRANPGRIRNVPLAMKLWDMEAWDQAYYTEIDLAGKKMGMDSPVVRALWELKERINVNNQRELDSIISVNGWPKISDVGHSAAGAAFLIIQHSTPELQQKYLPTIKTLCEQKEADWQSYALMYDRVQTDLGKPQLYGTQLMYNGATKKYELFPIEDEAHVDERRKAMGMGPLKDYLAMFGMKYGK